MQQKSAGLEILGLSHDLLMTPGIKAIDNNKHTSLVFVIHTLISLHAYFVPYLYFSTLILIFEMTALLPVSTVQVFVHFKVK